MPLGIIRLRDPSQEVPPHDKQARAQQETRQTARHAVAGCAGLHRRDRRRQSGTAQRAGVHRSLHPAVAVVLSAQATDISVNKATQTLFGESNTPAGIVRLGVDGVARHIKSIGLWQGKARNVVALSQILLDRYGGQVPHDRAALEALPGVGRKTANVVLNVAFGDPTMAVDTHIFRLSNRTGLAPGATVRAVEDSLLKRIPPDLLRDAHNWLILHGRYICKARKPECWRCPATAWCRYNDKTGLPAG